MIDLKQFNFLIVDDDENLRDNLCSFFKEEGASVFTASNGEEALQITLVEKIDIILSDVRMPIMDGIELLKSIQTSNDNIPLVWLMSGQCELSEESAICMGAEGLLKKPFNLHHVLQLITQSLR